MTRRRGRRLMTAYDEAAGFCRDLIAVSSLRRAPIITGISLNGEKEDEEEEARSSRFRWIIRIQRY